MPAYLYPDDTDFLVTRTGHQTITGRKTFLSASPTVVGLVIQGSSGQTGNLQEWSDSAGTILTSVSYDGTINLTNGRGLKFSGGAKITSGPGGATAFLYPGTSTSHGLIVSGLTSQTADLQQWQDSAGAVLARVSASGVLSADRALVATGSGTDAAVAAFSGNAGVVTFLVRGIANQTANLAEFQTSDGISRAQVEMNGATGINMRANGVGWLSVSGRNATDTIFVVRGLAAQTGNLAVFQNSAGTAVTSISSNGSITSDAMRIRDHFLAENQSTGSTSYTNLTTFGPTVVFTMPPSGLVSLNYSVNVNTGGDQWAMAGVQITRESDGVVAAPVADEFACQARNLNYTRISGQRMFAGTPGVQYRATMMYRTTAGAVANWERRIMSVTPSP